MDFKVGVEGTYGCAGFRSELSIHIISHMMRVVATDRIFARIIANNRHGIWMTANGLAQLLPLWAFKLMSSVDVVCRC